MTVVQIPTGYVVGKLTAQDDPKLWESVLAVLNQDFLQRYNEENDGKTTWYLLVGACSHWVRPNRGRWIVAGGFAWPVGYEGTSGFWDGLPEFDWSVILAFDGERWKRVEKFSGKKQVVLRVAIPTRTARHKQAAIHTRWSMPRRRKFYGFRNFNGRWDCVAASDEARSITAWRKLSLARGVDQPVRVETQEL